MMIDVRQINKSFGPHHVIKGLSLQVEEGETVVILGRSGVGKSVLLKHILGLIKPDSGSIFVDGSEVSALQGRFLYRAIRNMGMLFQGAALFDSLTVAENTGFYLTNHGDRNTGRPYSPAEIQERIDEALAMVGLEGTQDKMPSDLSGGMRKRAALARLIVYRPKVLLYDEPTTGLDPITAMQINDLINRIKIELKATSIVVTHDIPSALEVGDRLALHHEGKIAYIDRKEDFIKIPDPAVARFFSAFHHQSPIRGDDQP